NANVYGNVSTSPLSVPDSLKTVDVKTAANTMLGAKALANIEALNAGGGLIPVNNDYEQARLSAVKGTDLERMLIDTEGLAAFAPGALGQNAQQTPPGASAPAVDVNQVSPVSWGSASGLKAQIAAQHFNHPNVGCIYSADFADDSVYGLALALKAETDQKGLTG